MRINEIKYRKKTASESQIYSHLKNVDNRFVPNLSSYVDLEVYSNKLFEKSITFEAWKEEELVGLISAYFNNSESGKVFISNVSVIEEYSHNGIASALLSMLLEDAKICGIKLIELEVFESNAIALGFYKRKGFLVKEKKYGKYTMAINSDKRTQKEIIQSWPESATPIVSINSIAYNHAKFIRQALDSFLMQITDFPFEVLIHDDASTDGTADIIREYAEQYPDIIKPIFQTENQYSKGVKISLNYNFPRVRGRYLALCEGDDYWTDPLKLQKQVDYLEANPDCAICFHPVNVVYEDGSVEDAVFPDKSKFPLNTGRTTFDVYDLIKGNFIQTNSVLYRWRGHEDLPDFFSKHLVGDYQLHMYHAVVGNIGYIDEVMGVYRRHKGGIWWFDDSDTFIIKTGDDRVQMYINMMNYYDKRYLWSFRNMIAYRITQLISVYMKKGLSHEVADTIDKYFEYSPFFFSVLTMKIYTSTLYVDIGDGFSENAITKSNPVYESNSFSFTFDLTMYDGIRKIRYDPCEDLWCKIQLEKIIYSTDGINEYEFNLSDVTSNGRLADDGWIEFETFDPKIIIPLDGKIQYLRISGERQLISFSQIDKLFRAREKEVTHLRNSYAYRIGKLILLPVKILTIIIKLFKERNV